MSDTVTRCPTCQTSFRVTQEQLDTAGGMVRCGKCMGIFNAPDHRLNSLSAVTQATEIQDSIIESLETDFFSDEELLEELDKEQSLPKVTALIHNEFAAQHPQPVPQNHLRLFLGRVAVIALGALILAGQYVYLFSGELSRNENYRQPLISGCYYLGCNIDPFRDITKLTINSFIVQSHPTQQGAVTVDLLIENKARFRQPYPQIKLRFDDLHGSLVAQRIFTPEEYISEQNAQRISALKNIASGRLVHVSFSLLDPGLSAVNYVVELSE